ncbi:phage Gp37/Gp68 family protein [Rhizobium leguminosarum]|uniref:phage Gp37/Gp68 family protein n=1 Tax=Rhizobium leguminosarum TaxID=384 RepID=UPI001C947744|nr:phage Gp37/Gp68 family protein [Rhizobium leguminosarum]MBY5682688.1 phage Gp37/Gp68 family protein [Rhizobium leguminosarum]
MAENSAISWTRHTWNPWMGCTKVSPACDGCYAEAMMDKRYGKVQWGNAPRVRTGAHTWNDPFRWQRQAEKDGDRPFVFCASLADIFDNQVDPQWRSDAFEVMRKTPRLVYLLLTKRPQNIVKLAAEAGGLPRNAAIGTTVEDQKRANINVPALLRAKPDVNPLFTFLSCEPLVGPIDLGWPEELWPGGPPRCCDGYMCGCQGMPTDPPLIYGINWVISGGETDQGGHKARPTHPGWFRTLRDQCAAWRVPFHHKQNGEWIPWIPLKGNPDGKPIMHVMEDGSDYYPGNPVSLQSMIKIGKKASGRILDGVTHDAFPEVAA